MHQLPAQHGETESATAAAPVTPVIAAQEHSTILGLRHVWTAETNPAIQSLCLVALVAGAVSAALLGRTGEPGSQPITAAIFLLSTLPIVAQGLRGRRMDKARWVLDNTLMRTDPKLAKAAVRALALSPKDGSTALAQLHLRRLLGRASLPALRRLASRRAWLGVGLGAIVSLVTLLGVAQDPFRVAEGLNILAARDGLAPVAVHWITSIEVQSAAPAHVGGRRRRLRPDFPSALEVGSELVMHAQALRPDRSLVLTDGNLQVPFVDDGSGSMVVRWTVKEDVDLFVAAKFGAALIPEPKTMQLHAIDDLAPWVQLDDAPRIIHLLDERRVRIHWQANDDHGLNEVVLHLRSGGREIRRELSKPLGATSVDRGGMDLRASDPFVRKSHLPIVVTIEAVDNDVIDGPKRGRSRSFVLLPPEPGQREAMRYAALEQALNMLVDLLAKRTEQPKHYRSSQADALQAITRALETNFAGLRLGGRLAALVSGQVEALVKKDTIAQTETCVLAVDSALGALGTRDSRSTALTLSKIADDLALAIGASRSQHERIDAETLLRADIDVLTAGGQQLLKLGSLGRDLGEIVSNHLGRVQRAYVIGDRHHARLAAQDLAARLRSPERSFGSASGSGHGGVESGGGAEQAPSSEAAEQAAEMQKKLEQLAQEHSELEAEVERALSEASTAEEKAALQEALRRLAKQAREAVAKLPKRVADANRQPDRAAASEARSHAEAAANELEQQNIEDALQRGQEALEALETAARIGEGTIPQKAAAAKKALKKALDEAGKLQSQKQSDASERAKDDLEAASKKEEELSERARQLKSGSESSQASMPGEMLQRLGEAAKTMDGASKKLQQRDGNGALKLLRAAQRLLEMAQPANEQAKSAESQPRDGSSGPMSMHAAVPKDSDDEAARTFRERVTKGMGHRPPSHLRDAFRRYSGGLLR